MKQPSVYSREGIVAAALDVIREQGWAATSTRAIAKKLGSSTMPIYSHLRSREELEKEARRAARELLQAHQRRPHTGEPLLDLAFGYVAFARDERNLFRFLFLEASGPDDGLEAAASSFEDQFGADRLEGTMLAELPPESLQAMLRNTWIYTHGLAMMANGGGLRGSSDEALLGLLREAGQAFFINEKVKAAGG